MLAFQKASAARGRFASGSRHVHYFVPSDFTRPGQNVVSLGCKRVCYERRELRELGR